MLIVGVLVAVVAAWFSGYAFGGRNAARRCLDTIRKRTDTLR